jgi:tetratricopeptide (TPR) repeat protein
VVIRRSSLVSFIYFFSLTNLTRGCSSYLQDRSRPKECIEFSNAVFSLLDHSTEDLRVIRAEIHGTRASLAINMNDPEAALYHREENVTLREEAVAEAQVLSSKLAAAYSGYGQALMVNELMTKAVSMFEKSMEIRKKLPDFTREQLWSPLCGLGRIHWHRGEYGKAAELFLEALRDREVKYGRDDTKSYRFVLHLSIVV